MTRSVKDPLILLLFILVLFALVHYPVVAASKPPAPGTVLPQFQLEVDEDSLSVRFERKTEHEEKGKESYLSERSYSGYFRSLPLPQHTRKEGTTAEYKDGVLTVRIPKDTEAKKTKKVKIE